VIGVPQDGQNFTPAANSLPQFIQNGKELHDWISIQSVRIKTLHQGCALEMSYVMQNVK
jgi:hypothetical protein